MGGPMNATAAVLRESFDLENTIENIGRAETSFDIFKQLKAAGAAFGLPHFLVTVQPPDNSMKFFQRVIITNWEAELLTRFIEMGTLDRSRIIEEIRSSICPITLRMSDRAEIEHGDVFEDLKDMVARGYDRTAYFPFRFDHVKRGAVSFTGARGPVSALEIAQLYYIGCCAFLRLAKFSTTQTQHNPLTDREIGVFKLVAGGLTAEQIGRELGITSHTVNYHITNTTNKLGMKNKIQALVSILHNGWLSSSSD